MGVKKIIITSEATTQATSSKKNDSNIDLIAAQAQGLIPLFPYPMMQFDNEKFQEGSWKTMTNNIVLASPHSKRLPLK